MSAFNKTNTLRIIPPVGKTLASLASIFKPSLTDPHSDTFFIDSPIESKNKKPSQVVGLQGWFDNFVARRGSFSNPFLADLKLLIAP